MAKAVKTKAAPAKTSSPRGKGRPADEETLRVIYEGCTLTQMMEIFRMDYRTFHRRLGRSDVKPCGQRGGHDIYQIHEVAPWVLPPKMDIEQYLKNMNPKDLPKMLTKEYWQGMLSRQSYLRKEGELWSTYDVQKAFSEIVQVLIMNSRVIEDEVDRKAELTSRQRQLVRDSIDALINSCRDKLEAHFIGRKSKEEVVKSGGEAGQTGVAHPPA